jgi:hypothetical protein
MSSALQEWKNRYSQYNFENLDTEGVLCVPDAAFVYVHKSHPVVEMLKVNSWHMGPLPEPIDGELIKMSKLVLELCNSTLRSKVLRPESELPQHGVGPGVELSGHARLQ